MTINSALYNQETGEGMGDIIRMCDDDPVQLLATAEEYAQSGQLDQAEYITCLLLLKDNSNADAWNLIGFINHARGQIEEALASFEKACSLAPDNIDIAKNLLDLYIQLGRTADADRLLQKLLESHPQDREIQEIASTLQHVNLRLHQLGADEWHDAIINARKPEDVADEISRGEYPEWVAPMLDHTKPGDLVVELGSGTGTISAVLALNGRKVVLVDYSRENLEFSRQLFDLLGVDGEFILADVTQKLPFSDGYADVVWSSGLLEHFSDDEVVHILTESARISKRAVISLVPNANSLIYRFGKWEQERSGKWKYGHEDPKWSMVDYFGKAGLEDIREYSIGTKHSLQFLVSPELQPAAAKLSEFLGTLSDSEIKRFNQGYLLTTVGFKRKQLRLAVIPSDPLEAYAAKGNAYLLQDYYNPTSYFDEVYCLSPVEETERFAYGMRVIPTTAEELLERIRDLGVDIVRAYGGFWPCDFAVKGKVEGVPVVVSVHDDRESWLYDSILQADHVIVMSGAVREVVIKRGVPSERIIDLPNRVNLDIFNRVEDKEFKTWFDKQFPGKHTILHIGRKDPQKNADTLIKALTHLGPDYTAIFIGRGNDDIYRKLASDCGVLEQCHFIQSIPNNELPKYYSACSCMCTPSRCEGFGIVFIEALACGAVVVTSNIAPMNEYITDRVHGILINDLENPEAVAAAVKIACTDKELRFNLQANARSAAEPFSKPSVDQLERAIYETIIKNRA
ncbi:MAG TPA: glycosyltransferase [Armatimonadota bacterium]|nr:glycosyltransferase [Armatimonadota bacterium]